MAEPFSIATGAIQVAGAGLQLAKTLYDYLDTVKNAHKHIKAIAIEVRLTSSVLEHLGALLKESETEKICSENITADAKAAFVGCEDAFREVDDAFQTFIKPQMDGTKSLSITGRVSWPFKKGKLEALQANLERLKTTLLLMLSVLGYARDKVARPAVKETTFAVERLQIQNLMKAKDDATERYERLILDFSHLEAKETTSHNPFFMKRSANDRSDIDMSRVRSDNTIVAMATSNQHFTRQGSRSVADQTTPRSNGQDTNALLLQLHSCSSAISRLTLTINAASLNLSVAGKFDADDISESYHNLNEHIKALLASYRTQQALGDASSHFEPQNGVRWDAVTFGTATCNEAISQASQSSFSSHPSRGGYGGVKSSPHHENLASIDRPHARSSNVRLDSFGAPLPWPLQLEQDMAIGNNQSQIDQRHPTVDQNKASHAEERDSEPSVLKKKKMASQPNPKRVKAGTESDPPAFSVEHKHSLQKRACGDNSGELTLELTTPATEKPPKQPSAMAMALSGQLGQGPVSLDSAASNPASEIDSPNPTRPEGMEEGEGFDLNGSSSPEAAVNSQTRQREGDYFGGEGEEEDDADADVEELELPSPPQRHGWRKSVAATNATGGDDDDDDLERQMIAAMADDDGDWPPAPAPPAADSEEESEEEGDSNWQTNGPEAISNESYETDRRFVLTKPEPRLSWAIGVLGTEANEVAVSPQTDANASSDQNWQRRAWVGFGASDEDDDMVFDTFLSDDEWKSGIDLDFDEFSVSTGLRDVATVTQDEEPAQTETDEAPQKKKRKTASSPQPEPARSSSSRSKRYFSDTDPIPRKSPRLEEHVERLSAKGGPLEPLMDTQVWESPNFREEAGFATKAPFSQAFEDVFGGTECKAFHPATDGNKHMETTWSVNSVDDLVKRWTTIEV